MITKKEDSDGSENIIITATPPVIEKRAPRLLLYSTKEGEYECKLCKQKESTVYLYARKQIHVCMGCARNLEAIMESNHKVENNSDQDSRSA